MSLSCTVSQIFNVVSLKSELGLFKINGNDIIRYIAYKFLFVFHCNYCHILYRF